MTSLLLGVCMAKAVKAKILYIGKPGQVLENVYLVWNDQKIVGISKEKLKDVDEVIEFENAVVTPAFIDAHSHIGMERAGEPSSEGEANEKFDSVLPVVDAL